MKTLEEKLKSLPKGPGVYFYKDKSGEIIYIGKAANLRNRVRQYFQKSRLRDPKTDALISEIADLEWREVETELDALFLEAEMVRRYMPRYNILLRDDKSFVYVRIDIKSDYPSVSFTRRPLDDGAEYLGPYLSKFSVNRALKYLRRAFPYSTHAPTNLPKRACLQAQIGLCPGLEAGMTTLSEYRKNLRRLMSYLRGNRKKLTRELEKEMNAYAKSSKFEEAASARDKLNALKHLEKQVIFGDHEAVDISKDRGLVGLGKLLGMKPPRRIEGFDISHMSGTDNVASMVVFIAGVPDKSQYRKFKMRSGGNDDFAHMREAITRRLSERNAKKWGLPDLILIDGGKGQISAAMSAMREAGYEIPMIGLAKRYEEISLPQRLIANKLQYMEYETRQNSGNDDLQNQRIAKNLQYDRGTEERVLRDRSQYRIVRLSKNSDEVKLLQRIRDESHRFAVSYHSTLKRTRQKANALEDIPGIGPATRRKLIRHFGSQRALNEASEDEVAKVIGPAKARLVVQNR